MRTACVFSLDDDYLTPFLVLFQSLEFTNSLPSAVQIYILHTDTLSKNGMQVINEFLKRYQRKAVFLNAARFIPASLPLSNNDHVSISTFYRLFIAEILPFDLEQALYLDCDMVALKSIAELFSLEINPPLAAVDHFRPIEGYRIWGENAGPYFNAGTLLINLKAWRTKKVTQTFLDIIQHEGQRIKWWDQDVLNIAFGGDWQRIPIWYNVCGDIQALLPHSLVRDSARLLHFTGSIKPWNTHQSGPFQEFWDSSYERAFGKKFNRDNLRPDLAQRLKPRLSRMRFKLASALKMRNSANNSPLKKER